MKSLKRLIPSVLMVMLVSGSALSQAVSTESAEPASSDTAPDLTYPIVDTNQTTCYDNSEIIDGPAKGEAFYGQDAQHTGTVPSYTDNGDGTVTDNVTGLVWTQSLSDQSMDWSDAPSYCECLTVGGITDWRVPTLKELWSIRDFSAGWPWLDTKYFYLVGDGSEGRQQHTWSSNYYLVDTDEAVDDVAFAVNDWTGHIKSFDGMRFVRCVSGDAYGINDFVDNDDGTITDKATGLMWAQDDSRAAMDWGAALAYAENSTQAGYDDWRLPNVKELQSIVDYSGVFPAIDSTVFNVSEITNVAGNADYPSCWTSTSNPYIDPRHDDDNGYCYAWHVYFGYAVDAQGNDTHGAGAVRFDTKTEGGPAGEDAVHAERGVNYVRLVRGGGVLETPDIVRIPIDPDRVVAFPDADMSGPQGGAGGPQIPDLAAAAEQLGVAEEELEAALGDPSQGPPDFAAAAAELGVTEAELMDALGTAEGGMPPGGQPPTGRSEGRR